MNVEEKISDEGLFHNDYFYFVDALDILEKDAETQCTRCGNMFVGWELRKDLINGALRILNYTSSGLTTQQIKALHKLISDLEAIPKSAISGGATMEASRRDMSQPCWIPLRSEASKLLKALEPATKRNAEYFNANKG